MFGHFWPGAGQAHADAAFDAEGKRSGTASFGQDFEPLQALFSRPMAKFCIMQPFDWSRSKHH